jgi:hypothetical protein
MPQIICLKNCVSRRWRGAGSVSEEEKKAVRSTALQLAGSVDGKHSDMLAKLVADIGKADWPRAWPDVVGCVGGGWRVAGGLALHPLTLPFAPPSVLPCSRNLLWGQNSLG